MKRPILLGALLLRAMATAFGAESLHAGGKFADGDWVVGSWQTKDGLPQNTVNAFVQTRDGYPWIGTSGGLARFDGVRFRTFGLEDGLRSVQIMSLQEDLLPEALKAECERFARQESIPCNLKLPNVPKPFSHEAALGLFRVTLEALRNIARYVRAGAVEVTLRCLDDGLLLGIRDNGTGFDPSRKRERVSLGLAGMRERVHLPGGDFDIERAPGHGTIIVAWVPSKGKPT